MQESIRIRKNCTAHAGGSGSFSSRCLTKTLLIGCDMTLGRQSHIPCSNCLTPSKVLTRLVETFSLTDPAFPAVLSSQALRIHL